MKLELDQITTYREMQLSGSVIRPQCDLEIRSKSWKVVQTGRTEVQPPRSVQNLSGLRWQRNSQCWGLNHIYSIQIDNKNNCTKTLFTLRYKAALSWWPLPQGRWFQQPSPCTLDSHQTQKNQTARLPQRCRLHCSGNGSAGEWINSSIEQQILHINQSISPFITLSFFFFFLFFFLMLW